MLKETNTPTRPRIEPGSPDPESDALTIRPVRPPNVTECFISHFSISDHFPVCFTRKVNCKVTKNEHVTTTYRCFKQFEESVFLRDLQNDLNAFTANSTNVDDDFSDWFQLIIKHLDNHAPIKTKRVKKALARMVFARNHSYAEISDESKRQKQWSENDIVIKHAS